MVSDLVRQVQGRVQRLWGTLTEYEIPKIPGDRNRLVGAIQEQLGYSRAAAEQMVKQRWPE
jgi:uncharacterized protein YjbJ (UPF0337 family)